ncbi:hypothetical protein AVEN_110938-1 [Araneus ventricosus]|uniref:Uncharacterized protein n=1 Tax=Araneus ventricosus TaxID=182803 RepID=A0A4Y2HDA7_ARAVE|nr:hypothetical protein AVEN_110938-1 [Araneus ventricosus]
MTWRNHDFKWSRKYVLTKLLNSSLPSAQGILLYLLQKDIRQGTGIDHRFSQPKKNITRSSDSCLLGVQNRTPELLCRRISVRETFAKGFLKATPFV